jgi:hypothetical protein
MFLEAWCYFNSLTGVEQYIAGILTISSQSIDDWGLRWDSSSNKIQLYHYNSTNSYGAAFSSATPNAGQWYHVAMSVVTGNPGYIYLFVNGVLQNSGGTSVGGIPRYTLTSTFWIGSPGNTVWGPSNVSIQDLRIVSGGTVPTTSFTPGSAPFGLASPTYVSNMGTTVLSLATQYYQTSMRLASTGTIQFTSRPVLTPVLSVGTTNLTGGGTIVVSQSALQPANGIVWTFGPTGSGVTLVSTTDYALNLTVATTVSPVLCTVTATNKNGYTTSVQFVVSSLPSGATFGLFASPTSTGTWNGLSYTIYTPQNSGTYPPLTLYGTSAVNSTVWDSGGVYSPGTGLPSNGASFNAFLPGTSTYGDYTMVQFSSGVIFSYVYIGLNGTNYNPIGSIAVWGSNTGTAPWTQLFSGSSGLTNSNYNTGTASFNKFTLTTTGSFTYYACQISTVLVGYGNNPSTGCLYWST